MQNQKYLQGQNNKAKSSTYMIIQLLVRSIGVHMINTQGTAATPFRSMQSGSDAVKRLTGQASTNLQVYTPTTTTAVSHTPCSQTLVYFANFFVSGSHHWTGKIMWKSNPSTQSHHLYIGIARKLQQMSAIHESRGKQYGTSLQLGKTELVSMLLLH